jgi:Zn-dependent protease
MKVRAAKRFGFYSYSELTDFHNALIGAGGIIALLILSFISYFPGFEYLSRIAAFYAFWNMIPISKLDGTQIFFGSRALWTALAIITIIFTAYALIL